MTREEFDAKTKDFYAEVRRLYGYRGLKEAKKLMEGLYETFYGSSYSEENCQMLTVAVGKAFIMNKEHAREKFTPKKYRNIENKTQEALS